jgi:hypothetical protein
MYQGGVDVVSVSSGQVDAPGDIAMSAIKTSLAALQVGSAFAAKIPYIAPVAGLLLQALAMREASPSCISSPNHVF